MDPISAVLSVGPGLLLPRFFELSFSALPYQPIEVG